MRSRRVVALAVGVSSSLVGCWRPPPPPPEPGTFPQPPGLPPRSSLVANVTSVTVGPATEGQPVALTATTSHPFVMGGRLAVAVRNDTFRETSFQGAGSISQVRVPTPPYAPTSTFRGQMSPQRYGRNTVEVSARSAPTGTVRRRTGTFFVDAPPQCFSFDNQGNSSQGWTYDGVYQVQGGQEVQVAVCGPSSGANALSGPALWAPFNFDTGTSFPRGSLTYIGTCFPTEPADGRLCFIDFVSPDLISRPEWQGVTGFSFAMSKTDSTPPVTTPGAPSPDSQVTQVQGLMKIRTARGETFLRELRPGGEARFETLPAGWSFHRWQFLLPADLVAVLQVRVRVFIARKSGFHDEERSVNLDLVCPAR